MTPRPGTSRAARRQPAPGAARLAAAVAFLAALACACGDDGSSGTDGQGAPTGGSVEAWCTNMAEKKGVLRAEYAEVFAAAPDGEATPSSALLSLDGSVESATSLRTYVEGLGESAPAEIAGVSDTVTRELDTLITELSAAPGQPGTAVVGGLGAIGAFAALDSFALENCGETI